MRSIKHCAHSYPSNWLQICENTHLHRAALEALRLGGALLLQLCKRGCLAGRLREPRPQRRQRLGQGPGGCVGRRTPGERGGRLAHDAAAHAAGDNAGGAVVRATRRSSIGHRCCAVAGELSQNLRGLVLLPGQAARVFSGCFPGLT